MCNHATGENNVIYADIRMLVALNRLLISVTKLRISLSRFTVSSEEHPLSTLAVLNICMLIPCPTVKEVRGKLHQIMTYLSLKEIYTFLFHIACSKLNLNFTSVSSFVHLVVKHKGPFGERPFKSRYPVHTLYLRRPL